MAKTSKTRLQSCDVIVFWVESKFREVEGLVHGGFNPNISKRANSQTKSRRGAPHNSRISPWFKLQFVHLTTLFHVGTTTETLDFAVTQQLSVSQQSLAVTRCQHKCFGAENCEGPVSGPSGSTAHKQYSPFASVKVSVCSRWILADQGKRQAMKTRWQPAIRTEA